MELGIGMECCFRSCSRAEIFAWSLVTSSPSFPDIESDESKQSISVSKPLSLEVKGTSKRSPFFWNLRTLPKRGLKSPWKKSTIFTCDYQYFFYILFQNIYSTGWSVLDANQGISKIIFAFNLQSKVDTLVKSWKNHIFVIIKDTNLKQRQSKSKIS